MATPELPPGLTPQMLQNIVAFLTAQAAQQAPRPSGTLQPNQIRGVNPAYRYSYREYPKALTPPPVEVKNEQEERTLRVRWNQPLPWPDVEPNGSASRVEAYYMLREYPTFMQPPQIVVQTAEEEEAKLASWNVGGSSRVKYPRYMFHAEKGGAMVNSAMEEHALGAGWYATPAEAMQAAFSKMKETDQRQGLTSSSNQTPVDGASDREALLARAKELGIDAKPSWGTKRLMDAIDAAEIEQAAA